jgi:DUF2958 family protein
MPWYEKKQSSPFENQPPNGLFFLSGDLLARRYQQDWLKGKKYPLIHYPSGLQRELWDSSDNGGIINVFGELELLRHTTRDEGFTSAAEFANQYDYTVARRGDSELLIFHSHSGRGYSVTYDNSARRVVNVKRFPKEAMELLDGVSRAVLPDLYHNEAKGLEAIAPVKFFTPTSNWTWYATEYDGEDTLFGLVSGFEAELGYFSLTELEGVRGPLGLGIERDLYFTPTTLRQLQALHRGG